MVSQTVMSQPQGFRAPPSLAAGNPFAALMREPKTARKKG